MRRLQEKELSGELPKKTGKAYKVFKVRDGKLYPPKVNNPGGSDTPVGVWLEAEVGEFAGLSATGRKQVKSSDGEKLAFRPGWHLGDLPRASQFDRECSWEYVSELPDNSPVRKTRDLNTLASIATRSRIGNIYYVVSEDSYVRIIGGGEYLPYSFIWAECDYIMEIDYQDEATDRGYMRTRKDGSEYRSKKFQHSYAGLNKLPERGYYRYRTNPKPETVPWVITGAIKVNKLLGDDEVNSILKKNGVAPIHRQGGDKTAEQILHPDTQKRTNKTQQLESIQDLGRNMNATEVVNALYREFKYAEFVDERSLSDDMVGLVYELDENRVPLPQFEEFLKKNRIWYRVNNSSRTNGKVMVLIKAAEDYVVDPYLSDEYQHWDDSEEYRKSHMTYDEAYQKIKSLEEYYGDDEDFKVKYLAQDLYRHLTDIIYSEYEDVSIDCNQSSEWRPPTNLITFEFESDRKMPTDVKKECYGIIKEFLEDNVDSKKYPYKIEFGGSWQDNDPYENEFWRGFSIDILFTSLKDTSRNESLKESKSLMEYRDFDYDDGEPEDEYPEYWEPGKDTYYYGVFTIESNRNAKKQRQCSSESEAIKYAKQLHEEEPWVSYPWVVCIVSHTSDEWSKAGYSPAWDGKVIYVPYNGKDIQYYAERILKDFDTNRYAQHNGLLNTDPSGWSDWDIQALLNSRVGDLYDWVERSGEQEQFLGELRKELARKYGSQRKSPKRESLNGRRQLKEAPDEYGIPTDDELDAEEARERQYWQDTVTRNYQRKRRETQERRTSAEHWKQELTSAVKTLINNNRQNFDKCIQTFEASGAGYLYLDSNERWGDINVSLDKRFDGGKLRVEFDSRVEYKGNNIMLYYYPESDSVSYKKFLPTDQYVCEEIVKSITSENFSERFVGALKKLTKKQEKESQTILRQLSRCFTPQVMKYVDQCVDLSNPGYWAWGGCFATFRYKNHYYWFEIYDDQAYISIGNRGKMLGSVREFCEIEKPSPSDRPGSFKVIREIPVADRNNYLWSQITPEQISGRGKK